MAYFDPLLKEQFVSLTTYRKNGTPVATPVWFAQEGDSVFVLTNENSGKHKRLRSNPHVELTPCNASGVVHGAKLSGVARVLSTESDEGKHINALLTRKYGIMKRLFDLFKRLTGVKQIYLDIKPA